MDRPGMDPGPLLPLVVVTCEAAGSDVNEADETGWTVLIWAAFLGRAEEVSLLLARKDVEINKTTPRGTTALMVASKKGHADVVELLLACKDVEINKVTTDCQFVPLIEEGDDVRQLLLARQDFDNREVDGTTALYFASQKGHVEVVQLLLARQDVEVNENTHDGATALYIASQKGHIEVVRLLLARQDVDVNSTHKYCGFTALIIAAQYGHADVLQLLLARQDVEVNKDDVRGRTALYFASENGHAESVRLLLAHPDVEASRTSSNGYSPLCVASQNGHDAIVRLLVAHRALGQVRLLAADVIDSLPAVLFEKLPGFAAQAAVLRLPLDVATALGDTEEERAAADVLASQSAWLEAVNTLLTTTVVRSPHDLARAREALWRAPAQSPSDAAAHAARERVVDAALFAATTTTAFRLAQVRQLIVRKILFSRLDAITRDALAFLVSEDFHQLFCLQRLEEFKLAQAESAARFALRHNGQEPADRLLGATRALAAAITALVAERDKLFTDAAARSI